jgi:hypothetical protein
MSLIEASGLDRSRWEAFIARIERRTARRVLIGAHANRLAELQASLSGAGYSVIGATDPGALVQLANAEARAVDAAVIDAIWLRDGAWASWVEGVFSARNVPCLTANGDALGARSALDRLLDVVERKS